MVFGEWHLRTALVEYGAHYNGRRPHRAHRLLPPCPDHPAPGLHQQRIRRRPILGGLINEYERAAQNSRSTTTAEFWNPTDIADNNKYGLSLQLCARRD